MSGLLGLACLLATPSQADSVFLIGNSLTNDTVPLLLDGGAVGDVEYHIVGGQNLSVINNYRAFPEESPLPFERGGTPWADAFASKQYDFVSVQPYRGTNLEDDISVINNWMQLQPTAQFILHPGWSLRPGQTTIAGPGHDTISEFLGQPSAVGGEMTIAPAYINGLINSLEALNPGRDIISTRTNEILFSIHQDIENGLAPYSELGDLYRDDYHFNAADGRFLAHNALRFAIGQEFSDVGFSGVSQANQEYLTSKIFSASAVPEPSSLVEFAFGLSLIGRRRHRHRQTRLFRA